MEMRPMDNHDSSVNVPLPNVQTQPVVPQVVEMSPTEESSLVNPSSQNSENVVVSPPAAKRKIPKILLILPLILILALVVFGIYKLVKSRTGQLGSASGEIQWWGLWEDESIINPLVDEYQQKNPNIKIKYIRQSQQDYRERLINALAKGNGPDIFEFHNTWVPMMRPEFDTLPNSVFTSANYSQTFYPIAVSDLTAGAGIVGIPLEYDAIELYINEDIFDRAAKSPPNTWDDFRQLAIDLTIKDEKGNIQQAGTALGRTENVDHWPEILAMMMLQNGVKLGNPQGKLAEDALSFFTLFSRVDKVWDQTLPPSTVAFAAGKIAMYFGPSWRAHEIKIQNPKLKFKVVPVPQIPQEATKQTNFTYATYWVQGVSVRSKFKKESWDFLKFLSDKATLEKFYQNASKVRAFGEPYPRTDMANILVSDPILGAFISGAPSAKSWYLASRTFDGPTGINSQINKYFEDAVNGVVAGAPVSSVMTTVASGVNQVLSKYGIPNASSGN